VINNTLDRQCEMTFLTQLAGEQYEDYQRRAITTTSQSTLLLQKRKAMKQVPKQWRPFTPRD
jgi:hypothetical protein